MTDVCGKTTENMRQQQTYLFIMIYNLYALFLGATWIRGFIIRNLIYLPLMMALKYHKVVMGDELNFGQEMFMLFISSSVIEAAVYMNYKAQVQLFLKVKSSE